MSDPQSVQTELFFSLEGLFGGIVFAHLRCVAATNLIGRTAKLSLRALQLMDAYAESLEECFCFNFSFFAY